MRAAAFASSWIPACQSRGTFVGSVRAVHSTRRLGPKAAHRSVSPLMSSVVIAPGQGAQAVDMLSEWVAASPAAADLVSRADTLLGERLISGKTLSELVREGPEETLGRTDIAQPAIYVTSLACWAGMQELGLADPKKMTFAAGLSLGEYTALVIAGAISFEDGLELVTLRGRAMQDAAESSSGGMLALIGADEGTAATVVDAAAIDGKVLVAANFNAPGQVVLSGSIECIERASLFASGELKLRIAKLDVAGAFHSPLMAPAAERLEEALASTEISIPRCRVMSNVTGKPHEVGAIRKRLVQQLTSSVRWSDCMDFIIAEQANDSIEFPWSELAPGKTLTGIMRKINRRLKVTNFAEPPVKAEA